MSSAANLLSTLTAKWLADYLTEGTEAEIVTVEQNGFSYLFDLSAQRLIAAWGVSRGRTAHRRDSARMRGHPLSAGVLYQRGHAIPHRMGGGADINLVPQRANVNMGPFRRLERRAIAHPGSLYFTRWLYEAPDTQTPCAIEQGLIIPGRAPEVRIFDN